MCQPLEIRARPELFRALRGSATILNTGTSGKPRSPAEEIKTLSEGDTAMPLPVRVFNALVVALLSAAALLAAGLTARAQDSGATRPLADTSRSQDSPTTLTWG
jgi:hypothetical protein